MVMRKGWNYKTNQDYYLKRDRAFLSLMFLSGLRVSEVLRIREDQFDLESDLEFVIVRDVQISKRKVRTIQREGVPKIDVALPLSGELSLFTKLVLDYLSVCESERLFTFGPARALVITKATTGKWNHYFRSQRLSHLINLIRSTDATAKIVGIKNPGTIAHYYKGTWREFREELSR